MCYLPWSPSLCMLRVCTQSKTNIRIYNLQTQALVKKLLCGTKWLSGFVVHPAGGCEVCVLVSECLVCVECVLVSGGRGTQALVKKLLCGTKCVHPAGGS